MRNLYIYIYACVHIYIYAHRFVCMHACVCISLGVELGCICVCVGVCACEYVYMSRYRYYYVYVCVSIGVSVHTCMRVQMQSHHNQTRGLISLCQRRRWRARHLGVTMTAALQRPGERAVSAIDTRGLSQEFRSDHCQNTMLMTGHYASRQLIHNSLRVRESGAMLHYIQALK